MNPTTESPMDNIAGSPVEGKNFFGREADIASMCETLALDDILLLGPRRIGKTSVARAVMAALRGKSWRSVEINVASCIDERGFIDKLSEALKPELESLAGKAFDAIREPLATLASRIKSVSVAGSVDVALGNADDEDWTRVASDLVKLIAKAESQWLIYVDELPIFLYGLIERDPRNGVQRVRRFLDWFRNDVRGLPGARWVHWLVSGSVGLDTLVQQHGMADSINSFKHRGLEAFSKDQALALLNKLASSYAIDLPQAAAERVVAAVQWPQPYYLQQVFHNLRERLKRPAPGDWPALIEQAMEALAQPGADNDFHHWEKRLFMQLGSADAEHARALLFKAAADPAGVGPELLLAVLEERLPNVGADEVRRRFIDLRDILQRDAYWWPDESSAAKRYRFRLEPLRRWWLRRNSL